MKMTKNATIDITAGDYRFSFFRTGDLQEAVYKTIMINQLVSHPVDGSLNNLYLRFHRADGIEVYPLLGVRSESQVEYAARSVKWTGTIKGTSYEVHFHLTTQGVWFWDVVVEGAEDAVDIVYGQDVGIADKGAVRSNEAYLSQYIDHKVLFDERLGYVVCSRQNMQQSTGFPYLQQGSLTKAIGYSTDGFQFFGLSYKETNLPEILTKAEFPNEVYQYEFAYTGLQSAKIPAKQQARAVFYGFFNENHQEPVDALEFTDIIMNAWAEVNGMEEAPGETVEHVQLLAAIGKPLITESLSPEEVAAYFPQRFQEEWEGETLLSFFTDTYEHVVLKEKELLVERPHGHILMTGQNDRLKESVLTSTSFMYGIFNSQLVVGNTNFNKMLTNARNALNVMKTSGQRIYVQIEGQYRLLTMPSMYEIGFNYCRWYYKTKTDMLIITNFTSTSTPELHLHVQSKSGKAYRYLVTNQVAMNTNEYEVPYHSELDGDVISYKGDPQSDNGEIYPKLTYRLRVQGTAFSLSDERKLLSHAAEQNQTLSVLELAAAAEWKITIQGLLNGEALPFTEKILDIEKERYRTFFRQVMNHFHLSMNGNRAAELEKVNALAWWYTHNMLVHYSVPHGLEQYGGAAWGTRDVCQGPTEYFLATRNDQAVKEIIKKVYTFQFEDDGNWPQWFMFDEYSHIQAEESHGDVIVWPLKVLSDYLTVTHDYSILREKVPYKKRDSYVLTEEKTPILEHVKKEVDYIKNNFIPGTSLSSYGDGDWDDTLQPANAQLKKYMVSSWTVALTYQALRNLGEVLREAAPEEAAEFTDIAAGIESDYRKYLLKSDVIPGFLYLENPGEAEMMLHPEDTKTGIEYRLLPMTRSMIAELLTAEEAESHYQLIKTHLYFPDGVRLMNQPASYTGGVSRHFKRAEQAANFGREIGLQYVHAHIRFIEAMAKLGKVDEVWDGLTKINPVQIQDAVPNAERRQSNAYFSSSDGKFSTRYEALERFDELKTGSVPVKGGWRIYSSGPGIYMNQLISNCLGIRQEAGTIIIDPVLPDKFAGLTFEFMVNRHLVHFVYHLGEGKKRLTVNGREIEFERVSNRYRDGGMKIKADTVNSHLTANKNIVDIWL
ncbi:Cellobiose phosphorylase [Evansella caseinilytica]|uniref:Cellobiose phosphorylase n=1 Tax=Evansella caseinilytica TaxID=1503961 RepID=A0A1H3GC53_9BACI|nr:cellobiose phosphorylase [Evansella caseinilytica]SDY00893.1 Cellobiose phosphorylase [Evansella caseinilytica]